MQNNPRSDEAVRAFLAGCIASVLVALFLFSESAPAARAATFTNVNSNSPAAAPSATISVTNTNDSGVGSLRQAIINANATVAADAITFSSISYPATITLASDMPAITQTLTITGPGASNLAVSGNNQYRPFDVSGPLTLTISGITIREGNNSNFISQGSGMSAVNSQVMLTNVNFISNTADNGGAMYFGGSSAVTVTSSLFSGNRALSTYGGAIYLSSDSLTIVDSTFYTNTSAQFAGAIYNFGGALDVRSSLFISNTADSGGAIDSARIMTVTNSTFFGNRSAGGSGGAILFDFGGQPGNIINSTFSGNSTTFLNANHNQTLINTILANSLSGVHCSAPGMIDGGNNIDDGATCGWSTSFGSMSNTNPHLGPLANNGGPTQSMALLIGSPAIDGVIYNAPNSCPSADQRGITRPKGLRCDIGAYEGIYNYLFLPFIAR